MSNRWLFAGLLGFSVCAFSCTMFQEKEDEGSTITLDQVPAPVKATLTREAQGGKIDGIEKEDENGKTVYSADVTLGTDEYDVKVAPDGKLLEKKLEKPEKPEASAAK